ncbi:hypothetical protein HDK77DRAFT_119900 [Phyllosticta capitalensis]|uniref:Uncharacterized protein n=1 Tax=Phyllosticta capitalensis TaxID=121624 RepID=A0ABR1YQJ4_9PEZI
MHIFKSGANIQTSFVNSSYRTSYLPSSFGVLLSTKMPNYYQYNPRCKGDQRKAIYLNDPDAAASEAKDHGGPEKIRVVCKKQRPPQYVWVWPKKGQSGCYLGRWLDIVRGRGPVLHIKPRVSSKDCLHGHGPILQVASRGTPKGKSPEPAPRSKKVEEDAKTESRVPSSAGKRPNRHTSTGSSSSSSSSSYGARRADAVHPGLRGGGFRLVDPIYDERVDTWVLHQSGGYTQENEFEDYV